MLTSPDGTARTKALRPLAFLVLSVVLGLIVGLGAVVFRALIAFFHNLLFLGTFSLTYEVNAHTPASPWGALVILVPVLGAVAVVFLVKNFAPEAKGHGVPEAMDAVYYNKGVIRPVVAFIKSLASAISIGSGGAVGREGPIIQIGSSIGSAFGQLLRMSTWQCNTLIAAGTGAGIAATFNTPIGGILFAVEIIMHEVSVRTLVPVAVCTATGTYIGRLLFGTYPSFFLPAFETHFFHLTNPVVLIAYVGLGVITGVMSAIFIRSIYGAEDFFEKRVKGNDYTRHMLGMFVVGTIMYVLMVTQGHYYIQGVGYGTIQDLLGGTTLPLLLLLALVVLKLLATSLTLGSGGSGGIFSPALFIGATLGAAYGIILARIFPTLAITPAAFAIAGMAGIVGGATGAAMTAIVMIFEMTLDYDVIIATTITVALSYAIRKSLCNDSIYTLKLSRRRHYVPETRHVNVHYLTRAKEVMDTHFEPVAAASTVDEFARVVLGRSKALFYLVVDDDRVVGVIGKRALLSAIRHSDRTDRLDTIAEKDCAIVSQETALIDVVGRMRAAGSSLALVVKDVEDRSVENVTGIISRGRIADAMARAIALLSDD